MYMYVQYNSTSMHYLPVSMATARIIPLFSAETIIWKKSLFYDENNRINNIGDSTKLWHETWIILVVEFASNVTRRNILIKNNTVTNLNLFLQ